MNEIEFIQVIGNEICEGCGPDRDCGLEYDECGRIDYALDILHDVLDGNLKLEL